MDALRSVVSTLGIFDPRTGDNSVEANLTKSVQLVAKVPTVIAAFDRIRRGEVPVAPDPALSHVANFLYMLHGECPDEQTAGFRHLPYSSC
jgi:citrate synthase